MNEDHQRHIQQALLQRRERKLTSTNYHCSSIFRIHLPDCSSELKRLEVREPTQTTSSSSKISYEKANGASNLAEEPRHDGYALHE